MSVRVWFLSVVTTLTVLVELPDRSHSAERTVRDIQQELTDKGYDLGKVDGVWGNKSINALRKFQKDHGLSSTGVRIHGLLSSCFR